MFGILLLAVLQISGNMEPRKFTTVDSLAHRWFPGCLNINPCRLSFFLLIDLIFVGVFFPHMLSDSIAYL